MKANCRKWKKTLRKYMEIKPPYCNIENPRKSEDPKGPGSNMVCAQGFSWTLHKFYNISYKTYFFSTLLCSSRFCTSICTRSCTFWAILMNKTSLLFDTRILINSCYFFCDPDENMSNMWHCLFLIFFAFLHFHHRILLTIAPF